LISEAVEIGSPYFTTTTPVESSSNIRNVPPKQQALDSLLVAHRFTNEELEYLDKFADTVTRTKQATIDIVAAASTTTVPSVELLSTLPVPNTRGGKVSTSPSFIDTVYKTPLTQSNSMSASASTSNSVLTTSRELMNSTTNS